MGNSVVNFYVKTEKEMWLWFYVDHEASGNNWNLKFKKLDESVVQILSGSKVVAYYHVRTGEYFLHNELHSRGEFEVIGDPESQKYPVRKRRIDYIVRPQENRTEP